MKIILLTLTLIMLVGCSSREPVDQQAYDEDNTEMNNQLDFDRENSITQIQEVLETAESWEIEIIVDILESVGVRGVIRAEFIEQSSGDLPTIPILEVESEDNRIYYIHLSGGYIMTITDPEKGIIYEAISPMLD